MYNEYDQEVMLCATCNHEYRYHRKDLRGGLDRGQCTYSPTCTCTKFVAVKIEEVDHPKHYGGADDPYEHIKVCEALGWGYHIGNATKYLWRMGKKPGTSHITDLKKAIWLLDRLLKKLEAENARDSHSTSAE